MESVKHFRHFQWPSGCPGTPILLKWPLFCENGWAGHGDRFFGIMKDGLLIALITLADTSDTDPPAEQDITLIVGGFLISGYVVSHEKYMQHNPTMKAIWRVLKESNAEHLKPDDDGPNFIHLRDAKYFTPGGNPIPNNMSIYCRIALDSVHGFSLGTLEAVKAK